MKPRKYKVRTTLQPGKEIEVTDQELLDLRRQRLIVTEPAPPPVQAPAPAPVPVPVSKTAPKKTATETSK